MASVAAAMIAAIEEATFHAEHGSLGADFQDLVLHAQEMYAIAMKELNALPDAGDFIRGMAETIGVKLADLGAMLDERSPN
ncbi:MAG: hypothetical protein ABI607_03245 [Betaproteobacteria bacterium]